MLFPTYKQLLVATLLLVVSTVSLQKSSEDGAFWYDKAMQDLDNTLNQSPNMNRAKNTIVFIGDGMGVSTVTAARIYKGQLQGNPGEESEIVWEKFPYTALSKTYVVDKQTADSASSATAFWCGYKGNYYTIGVDANVQRGDCEASKDPLNSRPCILERAMEAGKSTGIVTNTRITHATPAGLYAKSPERYWECDGKLGVPGAACKDIARQLVENRPGRDINVVFGGGRQLLMAEVNETRFGRVKGGCQRQDGRNLVDEWLKYHRSQGRAAEFVSNRGELDSVNVASTDHVMGLFSNSHMGYERTFESGDGGRPTLAEMVTKAIQILQKNPEGFFLAVEGGHIDLAHHDTLARTSLEETLAMERAVQVALDMTSAEDTLVVVTADHSHVLTIQGYASRGHDILGQGDVSDVDGLPYSTLFYSNGPNFNHTWNGTHVVRRDPSGDDVTSWEYKFPAGIPMVEDRHAGEDVTIYATGPHSHLFTGVREQNYIPHALGYAANIPLGGQKKTSTANPHDPQQRRTRQQGA